MNIEDIKYELKQMLGAKRFQHSLSTAEMAMLLSKRHGVSPEQAELAALLHDCAKGYSIHEMRQQIATHQVELDEVEQKEPGLWHAPLSAVMAKVRFNVNDEDILQAIQIHSTGDQGMSPLDKILYVSDYIEYHRKHLKVEDIRELAPYNLNLAVLMTINIKISYLLEQEVLIHPRSIVARNDLLAQGVKK
ncbi:bis(5'-nucleosyl)-tetraphosphatase (symmetrical) YqeK [Candidatus Desantisbacteria bacterium]|nr:bis(5'-nucleosyl)-tetraphosphatase (symmetrical) YqeK [Candidatus Desantisbacteria bacterium]